MNEAYEVLKDQTTRKKYDRYGKNWQEAEAYEQARQHTREGSNEWFTDFSQGDAPHFQDIFEQMFGSKHTREHGAPFRGFATAGADLETTVSLSLREVLSGTRRQLTIQEQSECSNCARNTKIRGCTL